MKSSVQSLFIVALMVLLPGCKSYNDDIIPAGMTRVSVKMLASSEGNGFSSSGRTSSLTTGDSVAFESILLGVSKLEFEPMDTTNSDSTRCTDDDHGDNDDGRVLHEGDGDDDDDGDDDKDSTRLEFKGAFVVDLLHGTSTPDFGVAQVVPGVFRKIKIKLAPILPDSNSVFVKGTVFVGDKRYNIEFATKMRMTVVIVDRHGIPLDGSLNNVLVQFDLDRFFEKINLASAHVGDDGVIHINPSFNPGLFAFLHLRIASAMRCGKDENRDGHIDD